MEKSRKRAFRRHHVQRLKNVRRKYWGGWFNRVSADEHDRQLGKVVQTPALCSCEMCGNPRKHFNSLTLKEEQHKLIMKEELNEDY